MSFVRRLRSPMILRAKKHNQLNQMYPHDRLRRFPGPLESHPFGCA
jgi:hypothetical protein